MVGLSGCGYQATLQRTFSRYAKKRKNWTMQHPPGRTFGAIAVVADLLLMACGRAVAADGPPGITRPVVLPPLTRPRRTLPDYSACLPLPRTINASSCRALPADWACCRAHFTSSAERRAMLGIAELADVAMHSIERVPVGVAKAVRAICDRLSEGFAPSRKPCREDGYT